MQLLWHWWPRPAQELRGYQVNQGQPDQPAHRALREKLGQPDRPALKVMRALQVRRASQAPKVMPALRGQPDLGEQLGQPDQRDRRDPRGKAETPVDRAGPRGLEVHRVYPV